MAKSKKQEATDVTATPAPKAPAKAAAKSKKAEPKAAAKPAAPAVPAFLQIDTNSAAKAAANLVANRDVLTSGTANKPESGAFRQMKLGTGNPTAGLNKILGIPAGGKKSNSPLANGPATPRSQAFGNGTDANRVGVPRRTNG